MQAKLIVMAGLAVPSVLSAQSFINGDFDAGTLAGWTVVNTANGVGAPGTVAQIDIDGPGPLGVSNAARFAVGLATFQSGSQGGIEMTQSLTLTAGVSYDFAFDWSAQRASTVSNAEGGVFSLIVDGVIVATQAAGEVNFNQPTFGQLTTTYAAVASGPHTVGIRITRPYLSPGDLFQYVDNVIVTPQGSPPCYVNCDGSTGSPLLTANDFQCFLNKFASGDTYANCDGSTGTPLLTANDFQCFLNKFAGGCS